MLLCVRKLILGVRKVLLGVRMVLLGVTGPTPCSVILLKFQITCLSVKGHLPRLVYNCLLIFYARYKYIYLYSIINFWYKTFGYEICPLLGFLISRMLLLNIEPDYFNNAMQHLPRQIYHWWRISPTHSVQAQ